MHATAWAATVPWSNVTSIENQDRALRGKLLIFHVERATGDFEKLELPLREFANSGDAAAVLERNYGRFLAAERAQATPEPTAQAG